MAGVSGFQLIQTQPWLIVVVPIVGAMFLHGCGAIAGPNLVAQTCRSIGNLFNSPMSLFEMLYNCYISADCYESDWNSNSSKLNSTNQTRSSIRW